MSLDRSRPRRNPRPSGRGGCQIYPKDAPEDADLIEGAIGEGSLFHERFGYCAQAVGPETAVLAPGWQERLIRIRNANTNLFVGLCLSPADVISSKLIAGREKDFEFARTAFEHQVVTCSEVEELLLSSGAGDARVRRAIDWLDREFPRDHSAQAAAGEREGEDDSAPKSLGTTFKG